MEKLIFRRRLDKSVLLDKEDFERVKDHSWRYLNRDTSEYAVAEIEGKHVLMHRFILGLREKDTTVDHINGNGLDNRRRNLRICTRGENMWNRRIGKNNSSEAKGVYFSKSHKKWHARIGMKKRKVHIGYYDTVKEAALAYNRKAQELFGEFALLNKV